LRHSASSASPGAAGLSISLAGSSGSDAQTTQSTLATVAVPSSAHADRVRYQNAVEPVQVASRRRRQRGTLVSMRSIPAARYNQWNARGAGGETEGGRVHRDTKDQGQASPSPELAFRVQMGQPASMRCGGSGVAAAGRASVRRRRAALKWWREMAMSRASLAPTASFTQNMAALWQR